MNERLPNITVSTDATLFREEAERARRYAAAMTEQKGDRSVEQNCRSV
jgi:hypothetical protein